jgi:hypothetical protein
VKTAFEARREPPKLDALRKLTDKLLEDKHKKEAEEKRQLELKRLADQEKLAKLLADQDKHKKEAADREKARHDEQVSTGDAQILHDRDSQGYVVEASDSISQSRASFLKELASRWIGEIDRIGGRNRQAQGASEGGQ